MKPELLVKVERGNSPEKFHYGFIFVIDESYKPVIKIGEDKNTPFPFRSAAKPLQASVVIDSGAYKQFNFNSEELAVICASHAGTALHTEKVSQVLKKIGLTPENLQCGAHMPLDQEESRLLIRENRAAVSLHNNCSGKHAGMLSVCVKNNWDLNNYLDVEHPLQKQIMKNIKNFCFLKEIPKTGYDGCSAPVPILPHYNMGVGFLNLFFNEKYSAIKYAMSENPYIAGGKGSLDSEITNASGGKLIAKVAAEGLCIVVNIKEKKVLVVKIIDADFKARSITVIESLKRLGWLSENEIQSSDGLKNLFNKEIRNWKQKLAGEIKAVFEF